MYELFMISIKKISVNFTHFTEKNKKPNEQHFNAHTFSFYCTLIGLLFTKKISH